MPEESPVAGQAGAPNGENEITSEMVEAGAIAVREIIGTEALYRGEAARIAEGAYKAMKDAAKTG